MKNIIIFGFLFFTLTTVAQQVQYFVINEEITTSGPDSFLTFDVYAMSQNGFKLGAGQLYFNYDTAVFGTNVDLNNNLEIVIDTSHALGYKIGNPAFSFYGQFVQNDNTDSRFSFSWQANFSDPCLTDMNIKFYLVKLFSVRLLMEGEPVDISSLVCFQAQGEYDDLTYTACGPSTCDIQDCIANPGFNITQDTFFCEDCRIVTTTDQYGLGSLRYAIRCTPPGDTVTFDVSIDGQTISIEDGYVFVNNELTIMADLSRNITLSNASMANTNPILVVRDDLFINGLHVIGLSAESMFLRLVGEGSIEFLDAEVEKVDIKD